MANLAETIDIPCAAWTAMERRRRHIVDLLGGTLAMRDAGEQWLPREAKESIASYNARLIRSVLYGALSDTIGKLAAKPFSKPIRIVGELPELLQPIERNADRAGNSLHNVAQDSFRDAASFGYSGFFVDLPDVVVSSLGDLQERSIYPAITAVRAPAGITVRKWAGRHTAARAAPRSTDIAWVSVPK